MPGLNIGFSEERASNDGFFGSLGRSIAAASSPNASSGISGFFNPAPVLAQDETDRRIGVLRRVWEENQAAIQASFRALEAGDRKTATDIITQVSQDFQQKGVDPGQSILPIFDRAANGYDQAQMRGMNTKSPDYLPSLGKVLNTPEQGMELGRSMQQVSEGQTRQALTQQKMDQDKQLFPAQLEGASLANDLTRSNLATDESRRGLYSTQNQGANLANQMTQEELNYFRKNQMLPGRAGAGGQGTELLDDEARHAQQVSEAVQALQGGKKSSYGMVQPYSVDEAQQVVASLNGYADELERRTGRRQPRVAIEGGQPRVVKDKETGEEITRPGGATPRVQMGRQQEPAPRGQFNEPLTPQALQKIPDEQIGQVSFDEGSLAPQQREAIRSIRREAQAAIRKAPASQRAHMLKAYNRRVLEALAAGGLPNANNQ